MGITKEKLGLRGFTQVSNALVFDKGLSAKAKGFYTMIHGLPENWVVTLSGLAAMSTDGLSAVKTALKELEDGGYLVRTHARSLDGSFDSDDYTIYAVSRFTRDCVQPETENQPRSTVVDFPTSDNRTLYNTVENKTDNKSLRERKEITKSNEDTGVTKDAGARTKKFVPPTTEEVAAYCKEHGYTIDAERFVAHYETVGWVYGKNRVPIKSWKSAVVTWVKNDKAFAPSPAPKKAVPWDYD